MPTRRKKFLILAALPKSALKKALAGDLDNIVMKALAKERRDRYISVEEFSEDIQRYLQGGNVKAETFERRNRGKNK